MRERRRAVQLRLGKAATVVEVGVGVWFVCCAGFVAQVAVIIRRQAEIAVAATTIAAASAVRALDCVDHCLRCLHRGCLFRGGSQ